MLDRIRLGGFSGTYGIRNAELARDKKQRTIGVTVLLLDDTIYTLQLEKRAKGAELLDHVFQHLELSERDYFGLQFELHQPNDVVRWLDPNKNFRKQWHTNRDGTDILPTLHFRVKFYASDPSRLQEEYTRYQFYLQIKRDILYGKLPCSLNTSCLLASYTVQSELGDYNSVEHAAGYLSGLQLLTEQNDEMERRIGELHKLHRGQLPADAEYNYLEHAKRLDMYGVDLHKATDSANKDLQLGVTSIGLLVYQGNVRINTFSWSKMVKVSFKRKDFFIQLRREPSENYDTLLGFSMHSHKSAKALWKSCVEHHSFFRLQRPHRLPRFLPLSLGSKFYYSGRTELQAVQESKQRTKISKVFVRSPSKRQISLSASLSQSSQPLPPPPPPPLSSSSLPLSHQLSSQQSQSSSNDSGGVGGGGGGGGGGISDNNTVAANVSSTKIAATSLLGLAKGTRGVHDNKVTSKQTMSIPRKAWEQQSDDEGGFIERCARNLDTPALFVDTDVYSSGNNNAAIDGNGSCGGGGDEIGDTDGLVTIRLIADDQGRFGFNVKGGVDLKLPVLVSRVAPHTPADRSNPRICEGDQVIMINGRDVNGLMHEQVVNLIRASREYRSGELVLIVKPNALVDYSEEEPLYQYVPENDVGLSQQNLDGDALFTQSLLLLSDGLASGALLAQYDQLYRKNVDLTVTEAKKQDNANKNRYRDISPYDCTRVVLINGLDNGDYINGNYVNMEIPGGTVNRYIATQGPLANTTVDFWRMVQQESSHLVVMLTTVMERGRPKCHQYWPVAGDELELTVDFSVQCLSEQADTTGSFVFRELILCDAKTNEKRAIQHMQYMAWPDHGVPADPQLFLQFTERVRAARSKTLLQEVEATLKNVCLRNADDEYDENGENANRLCDQRIVNSDEGESPEELPPSASVHQYISAANPPVIVHCSAGIGRTGVLILMDTALALMEASEPVYPLDIVQAMRDQRACMVQNVSQYRFVCECICAAYTKMMKCNLNGDGGVVDGEEDECRDNNVLNKDDNRCINNNANDNATHDTNDHNHGDDNDNDDNVPTTQSKTK